jgi:hypothetical protein
LSLQISVRHCLIRRSLHRLPGTDKVRDLRYQVILARWAMKSRLTHSDIG